MNKGKKNQKQEQPAITQEDKQTTDPFLRALAKKVRNLNKKIADIETLEKREDLKPEQQEKINSKPSIIEQRKKYEQFAKFYKTTLAEANKEQSTNQLTPVISKLSNAIVTAQYLQTGATLANVQLTANEKSILSNIGNIGAEKSSLKSLTSDLSSYLGQYLDNQKLVTKIQQAYTNQELLNTDVILTSSNQSQTKANTHKDTPKKQQKSEKKTIQTQQVVTQQLKQPIVSVPIVEQTSTPKQAQTAQQPTTQVNVQTNNNIVTTEPTVTNTSEQNKQNSTNEGKQQEERRPQRNNQYHKKYDSNRPAYKPKDGGYRQNGNRDGGYRQGGYKNYREGDRKFDKPRYQEKQEQTDDRRSDTSLEDSEDEANKRRNFNNKEIKSLQNDGFVVVQKRPKANEQQQYNKKQHGYKDRKPVYNH